MSKKVSLFLAIGFVSCSGAREPAARTYDVSIRTAPAVIYTAHEGRYRSADTREAGAHADTENVTWLFHVVFESKESAPLRIESAEASFRKSGSELWSEAYSRSYLERLEWIEGAFDTTTEYFMKNIVFEDNHMVSREIPAGPDLPAGAAISWVRIPVGKPWFALADEVVMRFEVVDAEGGRGALEHRVALVDYQQKVRLRLPFSGWWAIHAGNDLSTGHRRTGINALTMYGWDILKLGPEGSPYRTDGSTPQDYYVYGEPVLAGADGVVVDMRNDIEEYGIGETPPEDILMRDGDVWAGNLVTLDHGNGEYSFTTHMKPGSIPVKVGDRVVAGQQIGLVGNSGVAQVPHIHFNLMNGPKWLEAKGIPSLFDDFERLRTGGAPLELERGNPMTGWIVRPLERD
jgi:hypothetical protein